MLHSRLLCASAVSTEVRAVAAGAPLRCAPKLKVTAAQRVQGPGACEPFTPRPDHREHQLSTSTLKSAIRKFCQVVYHTTRPTGRSSS